MRTGATRVVFASIKGSGNDLRLKVDIQKPDNIHPGKRYGVLRQGAEGKYALIRRNRRVWLGVSVAGYHEHLVRRLQIGRRRHLSAEALLVH